MKFHIDNDMVSETIIDGGSMDTVTLSTKFQVVIPKSIRRQLALKPGEKFKVVSYDNRIEFILLKPMKHMRGFLKGMDSSFIREGEERL